MSAPTPKKRVRVATAILGTLVACNAFLLFPQKAEAQWTDFANLAVNVVNGVSQVLTTASSAISAEYDILVQVDDRPIMQRIAVLAAKAAVNAMTQSIVQWINSGFEGSPAFVTNLNNNLRQLGDGVTQTFVTNLLNNTQINSPYLKPIAANLGEAYLLYTSKDAIVERFKYTLGQYSRNEEAFRRGQFQEGGFNAWFAVTRDCGNDPYCVKLGVQEELMQRIDSSTRERLSELDYGRGFLSWKSCESTTGQVAGTGDGSTKLADAEKTENCTTKTPGSVIESSMSFVSQSTLRQLELAESFDQITGALASQLVAKIFSEGGLAGASPQSPGGGGTRPANQTALMAQFQQAVSAERTRTITNKLAWEALRPKIQQAVSACTASTNEAKKLTVDNALVQADAMIERAPDTQKKLDDILAALAQLSANPGADYSTVSSRLSTDFSQVLRVDSVSHLLKTQIDEIIEKGCT